MREKFKVLKEISQQALIYLLAPAAFILTFDFFFTQSLKTSIEKPLPTLFFHIFTIFFVIYFFFKRKKVAFKSLFSERLRLGNIVIVSLIGILARLPVLLVVSLIIIFYGDIALKLIENGVEMQWEGMRDLSSFEYLLSMINTGILVPIHEELFFRGVIFTYLLKITTPKRAIIFSSIVFAIFHLHPGLLPGTFILGLMMGFVYFRYRNIIYPILLHMIINIQPFIFEYFSLF